MKEKIDWHKAFQGDKYNLPGSQNQGIRFVQSVLVPLQAAIAMISGKYSGDLTSLKFYLSNDAIICESCCAALTRAGEGHDKEKCELYRKAVDVLTSDGSESERRLLLAEQERLAAKLNETTKKLSAITKEM